MRVEAPTKGEVSNTHMRWLRFVQEANMPVGSSFYDYRVALRREPITPARIPEYQDLLRAGKMTAKPVRQGTLERIRQVSINPFDTIVVDEECFAFGSPKYIPKSRFLATYGVFTCLAVMAYNPEHRAGFLGHAVDQVNAADAIDRAVDLLDAKEVTLFGGMMDERGKSFETVCVAEALLAKHKEIKVVGRDTLRNGREIFDIVLDTLTGEVILPSNGYMYPDSDTYLLRSSLSTEVLQSPLP